MLVGNKIDMADKRYILRKRQFCRQVTAEEGANLAKELDLVFYETSAKDGTNVNQMFNKLASILPGLEGTEITPSSNSK